MATLKFYGFNNAGAANISIITPRGKGDWEIRTLVDLPFVHRIDVVERGGVRYLVACALKSGHEYDDDWRFPGKVFAAELPEDLSGFRPGPSAQADGAAGGTAEKPRLLPHKSRTGETTCLICAENGIFRFTPPSRTGRRVVH